MQQKKGLKYWFSRIFLAYAVVLMLVILLDLVVMYFLPQYLEVPMPAELAGKLSFTNLQTVLEVISFALALLVLICSCMIGSEPGA